MSVELKVPFVGESITEVQIGEWLKAEGDSADKDQPLVEIESDKATVELVAPQAGRVAKVLKHKGETAAVGEVIGYLDETAAEASPPKPSPPAFVMPAAARALAEHGVAANDVSPSGPGG
ncbi:MAG TPA: biotin/lipoyl-containing protein, partial [Pirellulales bacterium]|nr:biotin/lipoyl-containing protein [Pirellulales bacterium]